MCTRNNSIKDLIRRQAKQLQVSLLLGGLSLLASKKAMLGTWFFRNSSIIGVFCVLWSYWMWCGAQNCFSSLLSDWLGELARHEQRPLCHLLPHLVKPLLWDPIPAHPSNDNLLVCSGDLLQCAPILRDWDHQITFFSTHCSTHASREWKSISCKLGEETWHFLLKIQRRHSFHECVLCVVR